MMEAKPGPSMNSSGRPSYVLVGAIIVVLVAGLVIAGVFFSQRSHPAAQTHTLVSQGASAVIVPTAPASAAASPSVSAPPSVAPSAVASESVKGLVVASTPLEKDIEAAYQKYLAVYSQAVLNLDTSHLSEILSGVALQRVTDEVNQLKAQDRPVRIIESQRSIALAQVTDSSATLIDEYTSESVYADSKTKEPLPRTGQPTRVRQSYNFQKINGTWKITDGTRTTLPEASQ